MKAESETSLNGQINRLHHAQLQSELIKVNDKLLKAEKFKSDFLSHMKNEINNPLASIIGLVKLNLIEGADLRRAAERTKLILEETVYLNFQMQNMFIASEIESGVCHPNFSNVQINRLVQSVIDSLSWMNEKKHISITILSTQHVSFYTDGELLKVVLTNVLSNAIKFSPDYSQVTLYFVIDADGSLVLSVKDKGFGIKKEVESHIFDRFKQGESGTTKKFKGQGLGLSIAQALIDVMDGSLTLQSQVGVGTMVKIALPIIDTFQHSRLFEGEDLALFSDTNVVSF